MAINGSDDQVADQLTPATNAGPENGDTRPDALPAPDAPSPEAGAEFGDWREQLRDRVKEIRARKLAGKHRGDDLGGPSLTEQAAAAAAEKLRAARATTLTLGEPPATQPLSAAPPQATSTAIDESAPEEPEELDAAIEEALEAFRDDPEGLGEYEIDAVEGAADEGVATHAPRDWTPEPEATDQQAEIESAPVTDEVPLFQEEGRREAFGDGSALPDEATMAGESWDELSEPSPDAAAESVPPPAPRHTADTNAIPAELRDTPIPAWALPRRSVESPVEARLEAHEEERAETRPRQEPEPVVDPDFVPDVTLPTDAPTDVSTAGYRTSLFDGLDSESLEAAHEEPWGSVEDDPDLHRAVQAAEASLDDIAPAEPAREVLGQPTPGARAFEPEPTSEPASDVYLVGEFRSRRELGENVDDLPLAHSLPEPAPAADEAADLPDLSYAEAAASVVPAPVPVDVAHDTEPLPDPHDGPGTAWSTPDTDDLSAEDASPALSWGEDNDEGTAEHETGAPEPAVTRVVDPLDPTAPMADRVFSALADAVVLALLGVILAVAGASAAGDGVAPFVQAAPLPFALVWALFAYGYGVFFVGTCGQTLGKMAMRVRVIGADNFQVGYAKAATRAIGYTLAALPIGLGLVPALRDPEHRGLHDRLSGTRVVKA